MKNSSTKRSFTVGNKEKSDFVIPPSKHAYPSDHISNKGETSFISNMVSGVALGAGSSIGHHAVNGMVNTIGSITSTAHQHVQETSQTTFEDSTIQKKSCELEFYNFLRCSDNFDRDCDPWYHKYMECMRK